MGVRIVEPEDGKQRRTKPARRQGIKPRNRQQPRDDAQLDFEFDEANAE